MEIMRNRSKLEGRCPKERKIQKWNIDKGGLRKYCHKQRAPSLGPESKESGLTESKETKEQDKIETTTLPKK